MNRPMQPTELPALDPRFGVETEARLAELRRLAMNARVAAEIAAGTWPTVERKR